MIATDGDQDVGFATSVLELGDDFELVAAVGVERTDLYVRYQFRLGDGVPVPAPINARLERWPAAMERFG